MHNLPTASIIVPMHNAQTHIGLLVACLKAQTHTRFQAVLVDDGSTDSTLQALHSAVADDTRFRIVQQDNAGPGVARNTGIDEAQGDYILFCDADDLTSPHLVEDVLACAQRSNMPDIVCYRMRAANEQGFTLAYYDRWRRPGLSAVFNPATYKRDLFDNFRNWPWDKAFKRTLLDKWHIRFPALYRTEDLAFTCSALASAGRIAVLDRVLYTYHVGSAESSTSTRDPFALDFLDSCLDLRDFLHAHNLYATYKRTYIQWVCLCCMVNLYELKTDEAFNEVAHILHDGGLQELNVSSATYQGGKDYVAGFYTANDVRKTLALLEQGDFNQLTSMRLQLPKLVDERARDYFHEQHLARERAKQYADEFGPLAGPVLRTLTEPLHRLKHTASRAIDKEQACNA